MSKLNIESFEKKFSKEWWVKLKSFFETEEAYSIYEYLKKRSKEKKVILPTSENTFEAFKYCNFKDLKVIIVGQEPYSSMIGNAPVASGIAFDCSNTGRLQPSLQYLWTSIKNNFPHDKQITEEPSIKWIAEQGVLFINYSLTVEKNAISSHLKLEPAIFPTKNLWESFIKYLFQDALYGTTGICYVLMGLDARKAKRYINPLGNYIFETAHPSFAARNNDEDWDADGVWKKVNKILEMNNGIEYAIEFSKERRDFQKELNKITPDNLGDCPF